MFEDNYYDFWPIFTETKISKISELMKLNKSTIINISSEISTYVSINFCIKLINYVVVVPFSK